MSDPRFLDRRSILAALGAGGVLAALPFAVRGETKFTPGKSDVLIVVDVQNCFTKGGSLEGDRRLAERHPHGRGERQRRHRDHQLAAARRGPRARARADRQAGGQLRIGA